MPAGGTHQSWASVQGSEQQKANPVSHFPVPKQESGNKRKTPRSKTQPRCLHPTGARFCQHRAGSSFQKPPGFLSNKICTAELFPLARLPSRHGNVPSPSSTCTEPWAAPEHRERHTRAIPLLPGFSRHFPCTENTTAGSQGRKSNPATEHGKHDAEEGVTEGRGSNQVTSQQLHLAIWGNSLLPSLPSVRKHHIQHLGGAVPHCLGTLHYCFFPSCNSF